MEQRPVSLRGEINLPKPKRMKRPKRIVILALAFGLSGINGVVTVHGFTS